MFRNATAAYRNQLQDLIPEIPSVSLRYGAPRPYNTSKVALLIENRPMGSLAPIIIQMIAVLPHDWRFRFMGSVESVQKINNSAAIRRHVHDGKLDLTYIPTNMSVGGQEQISHFLTDLWVNEQLLQPAEWLLVFQSDSMYATPVSHFGSRFARYFLFESPWHIR